MSSIPHGQAEVEYNHPTFRSHTHVARLEVPVDALMRVQRRDSLGKGKTLVDTSDAWMPGQDIREPFDVCDVSFLIPPVI
jgi:hypothetical protein